MNDFVALLVSTVAFCAVFVLLNLAIRLCLHHGLGPIGLGEGNAVQYALSVAAGVLAYRRAKPALRAA